MNTLKRASWAPEPKHSYTSQSHICAPEGQPKSHTDDIRRFFIPIKLREKALPVKVPRTADVHRKCRSTLYVLITQPVRYVTCVPASKMFKPAFSHLTNVSLDKVIVFSSLLPVLPNGFHWLMVALIRATWPFPAWQGWLFLYKSQGVMTEKIKSYIS